MGPALAALSPASLLVALLMVAAGVLLYAAPARRYRTLGQVGLALGAALAAARYLGAGAGLGVAGVGLGLAWLLDGVDAPVEDPVGLPMRVLLASFAAVAASALVVARPLGAAGAVDANMAWYWTAGVGLLLLLSERGPVAPARGGALLVGAVGLAAAHLLPGPPTPLLAASAAVALGLALAGRWLGAGAPLPSSRAAVVVDAGLAAAVVVALVGLASGSVPTGDGAFGLDPSRLRAGVAAALLALTIALHARLAGLTHPAGLAWGALGSGLVALAALAAPEPGSAGVIAAGVPLTALAGCAGRSAADPPGRPLRGAAEPPPHDAAGRPPIDVQAPAAPLLVAAASAVSAVTLALVASSYAIEPEPGLARVGLALALVHAGLLGAFPPWHLWALGLARRGATAGLAVAAGIGGLAGLSLLGGAVEAHPWLLGVVGTRSLALGIGLLGLFVGALSALAEERPARLALQLGAVASGVSLIALASDPLGWTGAAGAALVDRAFALGLALVGADALARWPADRRTPPARRLLRPAALPLWVGLAGLAGLPPTGGFVARWLELAAVGAERPDLVGLALLGGALGLLGVGRAGDWLVAQPVEEQGGGERPSIWRFAAPLLLAALYLLSPLYPPPPLAAAAPSP
ncbi:MAG TPA: hypothetical protein VG370_08110 [Chloroflexota bacterium]|nr:hypothetical protein [Chloroflexota bacterium]